MTSEVHDRGQQLELLAHLVSHAPRDLTLLMDDGGEVPVSRAILKASCDYFGRMLSDEWKQGQDDVPVVLLPWQLDEAEIEERREKPWLFHRRTGRRLLRPPPDPSLGIVFFRNHKLRASGKYCNRGGQWHRPAWKINHYKMKAWAQKMKEAEAGSSTGAGNSTGGT